MANWDNNYIIEITDPEAANKVVDMYIEHMEKLEKGEIDFNKYAGVGRLLTGEEAKERVERFLKECGLKSEEKDDVNE